MFKNRQNKLIKDIETGKGHWISRSAVVICLVVWKSKFLIVKRGKSVIQTGKWCLPCGYLDYDESIEECAVREIYEETGLDIRNYINIKNLKPAYIDTEPSVTRNQDLCFNFNIEINSEKQPPIDMEVVDSDETTEAKWIDISELSNFTFAFNHEKKIIKYVQG